jgi:hypothetical protein
LYDRYRRALCHPVSPTARTKFVPQLLHISAEGARQERSVRARPSPFENELTPNSQCSRTLHVIGVVQMFAT